MPTTTRLDAHSVYLFPVGGAAISWASKKQTTPTLSSTEAQLVAAVTALQETIYLRGLLKEIDHEQRGPTTITTDNTVVLNLTKTAKRLDGNSKHFNWLSGLRHHVKGNIIHLSTCQQRSKQQTFSPRFYLSHPSPCARPRVAERCPNYKKSDNDLQDGSKSKKPERKAHHEKRSTL